MLAVAIFDGQAAVIAVGTAGADLNGASLFVAFCDSIGDRIHSGGLGDVPVVWGEGERGDRLELICHLP